MKKTLLVSGDSYTDPNWLSEFHPELDTSWPKWPEILAKNWLHKYVKNAKRYNSSFVSATGSYESFGFSIPKISILSPASVFLFIPRIIVRLLKSPLNLQNPLSRRVNPHLRTNAFFIENNLFNKYNQFFKAPKNKRNCYELESGRQSLTSFCIENNGNPGIVDSLGNFFSLTEMHQSEVFRRGEQKYLITADNRTREYQNASAERKALLQFDTWKYIK